MPAQRKAESLLRLVETLTRDNMMNKYRLSDETRLWQWKNGFYAYIYYNHFDGINASRYKNSPY